MLASIGRIYRNAYSGLSKETWYLSLVMLINRSGTMVVPFLTMYVTLKLHFTLIQAGIVMACFGIGAITGAYLGGRITDKFGFYKLQLGALLSGGILFIVLGYIQQYIPLCIGTFCLSLCNESFRPANSTAIAYYSSPENRTRSYSLNRLAINLGWAAGGALGGFLASIDYQWLFWVDGITNISAAFLMLWILPSAKSIKPKEDRPIEKGRSPYKDGTYMAFIFLTILFAICFMQLFWMQPVFFATDWHLSEGQIGIIMATNGLIIAFLEMVIIFYLEKHKRDLFYIRTGVLMIGLGNIVVNIFTPGFPTAILSIIFITFGEIFSMPFMNSFWLSRTTSANRGSYAALYTMAWSAAQVIAPTFGSRVAQYAGFRTLWWMIGAISLAITIGLLFLQNKQHRQELS
jgi:predicted MFS family arabinose efflux permease